MTSIRGQRRAVPGAGKTSWEGVILSVQPRIRLMRSFDHSAIATSVTCCACEASLAGKNESSWWLSVKALTPTTSFRPGTK